MESAHVPSGDTSRDTYGSTKVESKRLQVTWAYAVLRRMQDMLAVSHVASSCEVLGDEANNRCSFSVASFSVLYRKLLRFDTSGDVGPL